MDTMTLDPMPPASPPAPVSEPASGDAARKAGSRRVKIAALVGFLALVGLAAAWRFSPLHEYADPEAIAKWLHNMRHTPWTPIVVVLIYVGANAIFFPNTVLNAATILGMGTVWGLPCALAGSLVSAMATYAVGRRFGREHLKRIDSAAIDRITHLLKNSGVLGIAMVRLLPVAPYTVVNLVAGAAKVRPFAFGAGTFLGLLPGNLLMTAFGHQLRQVLRNPSKAQIAMMVGVLVAAAAGALWARNRALAA